MAQGQCTIIEREREREKREEIYNGNSDKLLTIQCLQAPAFIKMVWTFKMMCFLIFSATDEIIISSEMKFF